MAHPCLCWRGEIAAYIVGALDPAAAAAIEHHLAQCTECRAEFNELAPLRTILDRYGGRGSAAEH